MAAASRSSKESATARNVRREDIDRRRKELLDRIKNVDESTLRELTLSVGKPQVAEDFHKYVFGSDGSFTEVWTKAHEV